MRKFYERMICNNGKMQYAIELPGKQKDERSTFVLIRNGEVYFENSYWSSITNYDGSEESDTVAKQIFMDALRCDIKKKIGELKLLESIFNDIGLVDLLGSSFTEGQKLLISQQIKEEVANAKETIKEETKKEVIKTIKPRAIKKGLN